MKKPEFLLAAENAAEAAGAAHKEAAAKAKELEAVYFASLSTLRQARIDADANLPQCMAIRCQWRSGKEESTGWHVIVRKTPSGLLITRPVGQPDGASYKHKWNEHRGVYVQAEKGSLTSDSRELRHVPAEWLPVVATTPTP